MDKLKNYLEVQTQLNRLNQERFVFFTPNNSKDRIFVKLELLVSQLTQIKSSDDWEEISTSEQDVNLQKIINSLEGLSSQFKN